MTGDRWATRRASRALIPFARQGVNPPYREGGVAVVPVTARDRVLWGSANTRSDVHLIESLAGAWTPIGLILGARWLCGKNSTGATVYNVDSYWETWREVYRKAGAVKPDDAVCEDCIAKRDGIEPQPCVYRVYDKRGQLLYIGSTRNWRKRRVQHAGTKWWWPAIGRVELEHFASVVEARDAEIEAIQAERPRMNVRHNRGGAA